MTMNHLHAQPRILIHLVEGYLQKKKSKTGTLAHTKTNKVQACLGRRLMSRSFNPVQLDKLRLFLPPQRIPLLGDVSSVSVCSTSAPDPQTEAMTQDHRGITAMRWII